MYGGAAGGGKSDALLMGALQYVDVPNYNAILFRRTYADLSLPGALMDRAGEWLGGSEAHWNSMKHIWTFPSGATLTFGNLENVRDKYRYQSAEFQYIGFDELSQFLEDQYRYLFSRLRRLEGSFVPLRMRGATNPGGIGHAWVKQRFIISCPEHNAGFQGTCSNCIRAAYTFRGARAFIPALLTDNPYLDQEEYVKSLNELDPITRRQLLRGDWTARHGAGKFKREWLQIVTDYPKDAKSVRYWDMAATTPSQGKDPDYTVGLRLTEKDGQYWVVDVRRDRLTPERTESLIKQTAMLDGIPVAVYMEEEPGSEGKALISYYSRKILRGYEFRGNRATGSKEIRANPVSSAAEAGNIKLVNGVWINEFLDELEAFPIGGHDDQVDALSGAFSMLRVSPAWVQRIDF